MALTSSSLLRSPSTSGRRWALAEYANLFVHYRLTKGSDNTVCHRLREGLGRFRFLLGAEKQAMMPKNHLRECLDRGTMVAGGRQLLQVKQVLCGVRVPI